MSLDYLVKILSEKKKEDEKEIIEILQLINAELLNKYYIKLDGIIIYPLQIEAYYYKKCVFEDENTYKDKKQKNRYKKLYFHHGKQSKGIDIVLSTGNDYYLAFLIKGGVIENDAFYSQANLYYRLKEIFNDCLESFENDDCILNYSKSQIILKSVRVNMKEESKYAYSLLSASVYNEEQIKKYKWAKGFAKQWTISINSLFDNNYNEEKAYNLACERNGFKIDKDIWNDALRRFKEID